MLTRVCLCRCSLGLLVTRCGTLLPVLLYKTNAMTDTAWLSSHPFKFRQPC